MGAGIGDGLSDVPELGVAMKYPVQAYCLTCPATLDAKLQTQGAADQARALFYRQHPAETCDVRNGLPPRTGKVGGGSGQSAKSRKHGLAYDDDEYHAGGR